MGEREREREAEEKFYLQAGNVLQLRKDFNRMAMHGSIVELSR